MILTKAWTHLVVPALIIMVVTIFPVAAAAGGLEAALDNPRGADGTTPLAFSTNGDAVWSMDTTTFLTNASSARSGVIGNSQYTAMTATVTGPATLSFYQKISSEPTYDALSFLIDGVAKYKAAGSVNWQQKLFTLPSGTHSLVWKYAKNGSIAKNSDAAWIDQITVSPHRAVNVTSPKGGENFLSASTGTITWNAPASAEQYDILYSINNGSSWQMIATGYKSSLFTGITYTWTWPVPKSNVTGCRIKIVARNKAGKVVGTDISDKPFTVSNVMITSPNGGNMLNAGGSVPITWKATPAASNFVLSYSWDNGSSWHPIGTAGAVSSYSWIVPIPPATKTSCKVKIVAYNSSNIAIGTDMSDAPFTMQVLAVTSPNGGEVLNAKTNSTFPISFTVYGIQNAASATISYSTDNGTSWANIITLTGGVIAASHTYGGWQVPAVESLKPACRIKVVLKSGSGAILATDMSDATFTIQPVFTLSGAVTLNGTGRSGVAMMLSGDSSTVAYTDANGRYSFSKLLNGSYTITPSHGTDTFTPSSANRTISGANVTGVNFIAKLYVDTVPPSVPTGLVVSVATPASTTATISWNASSDNIGVSGYKIYRNGLYLKSVPWGGMSTSDTGLSLAGSYCYAVSAYDGAGNESARCAQLCVDRVPPNVPSIQSVIPVYPTQIDLLWTAATDTGTGVAGYNLYRDGMLVKSSITTTGGSNGGLMQGSTPCFTVTAYDKAMNESQHSAPSCTTLPVWQYEFVTRTTNTENVQNMNNGDYSMIVMDGSGHLHAIYINDNTWPYSTMQYATNAPGSWATTTVPADAVPGTLAVDSNNKPHIIYSPAYSHILYHTTMNSPGTWVTTTIADGNTSLDIDCHAIAVDQNDHLHVSYCDENGRYLKYATNASGTWVTTVIDTDSNQGIIRSSIAIDAQGGIHISYLFGTFNDILKYATNTSGGWTIQVVDPDVDCYATSIGIDSHGYAHVAYAHLYYGVLRYATNASGQWVTTAVDTPPNYIEAGNYLALKVDRNDMTHIVYQETDDNGIVPYRTIKHATNASGEWEAVYVVEPSLHLNLGYSNSIAIGPDNKLHFSTYDARELGMKHWFY